MLALCASILPLTVSLTALAETDLRDQVYRGDFPVNVNELVFDNAPNLTRSNEVCWGAWCARVPNKRVVALYWEHHDYQVRYKKILIKPFECRNEVIGYVPCQMSVDLNWDTLSVEGCFVSIDVARLSERTWKRLFYTNSDLVVPGIECPSGLN